MKKKLTKKVKKTSNAIYYFSGENLLRTITTTTINGSCSQVVSIDNESCPC